MPRFISAERKSLQALLQRQERASDESPRPHGHLGSGPAARASAELHPDDVRPSLSDRETTGDLCTTDAAHAIVANGDVAKSSSGTTINGNYRSSPRFLFA